MEKKGTLLMKRYEVERLLGQGNFAKVYLAKDTRSGETVAIKAIDKAKVMKPGLDEQIKREISVMRLARHPNIVTLYEVMASKNKIYLVLEYAKGGELFDKVARGRFKEDAARWIFQQLINAVDFCHSRGVYHRDLKLENLLLDEDGNLKVSDFGLSALAESKRLDGLLHTICGTPAYVAPEVVSRRGYDGAKADIWSCGVILYALLAGHLPFRDSNLMELYRKLRRADYKCPNWFPPEVRKLLSKILDPNLNTRISISKIMENPWFRKGLGDKTLKVKAETTERAMDAEGAHSDHNTMVAQTKQESAKLTDLNAFDIISMSSGFDLSGLFVDDEWKECVSFTSQRHASSLISKLKEVANFLKLKVVKKDGGLLRLEGPEEEKVTVSINVEIFEFTPSFHLVEIRRCGGDTLEYQKMLKEGIRPALEDVVWAWLGDQRQQEEPPPSEQ